MFKVFLHYFLYTRRGKPTVQRKVKKQYGKEQEEEEEEQGEEEEEPEEEEETKEEEETDEVEEEEKNMSRGRKQAVKER
ncbi:hypothetical protein SOVF_128520 [Spinacia oleracea]|nr:hypothetical protein SOVF_128520 [Spinacia oleracea]